MRHRRRCKGRVKLRTRQKACNACVQAKVKCCYRQPTCTRCTKRGTPCIYATSSDRWSEPTDTSSTHNSTSSQTSQLINPPTWDFSTHSYSLDLDAFDMTMAELSNPPLDTCTSFDATQPLIIDESTAFTNTLSSSMLVMTPTTSSSNGSASSITSLPLSSAPYSLVHILSDYPTLLMKGSFSTPILHMSMYALYSNIVPDMTYLPHTSMAICCGNGLNSPDTNRFFRRALDAAQQRLIGSFVSATR